MAGLACGVERWASPPPPLANSESHAPCRLWLVRNAEERQRAHDFFTTFASDRWRFEELREDGTEVWRLPGARIHTIMGIQRVNASPSLAL